VSIWAGTNGHLDDVPVEDINRFETEFLEHLKHKSSILTTLAQTNKLEDDTAEALKTAIVDFKKGFFGEGDNHLVGAGHEEHDAISGADVDQEKIVKQKR
jgi:F-type H+-transporting ATPase subunit alpha